MRVLDFGFVYSLVVYVYGSVLGAYNDAILENLLNMKRDQQELELKIDYQTSSTLLL